MSGNNIQRQRQVIAQRHAAQGGYIALMAAIIISAVLLVMAVDASGAGWNARFNILGTEAKERASALAEGCADQALAALVSDPSYVGNAMLSTGHGTCRIFPILFDAPAAGLVTIRTQAEVRKSYANLERVVNVHEIHLGVPIPDKGVLFIVTQVVNDGDGTATPDDFTMRVAAANPSRSSFPGSSDGVTVTIDAGAYAISQDPMHGYAEIASSGCSGVIAGGQIKFCTITNDDITTTLSVVASVTNNDGGTLTPSDLQLFIDGSPASIGTRYAVSAGAHVVTAATPNGYTNSVWGYDCSGDGSVSIPSGSSRTCAISFDDMPPPSPSCAEIVSIIDRTGSMLAPDLANERAAIISLIDLYSEVSPLPKIGVGSIGGLYGGTAAQVPNATNPVVGELTTVYGRIVSAVTAMTSSNSRVGTDLVAGITVGNAELNSARHVPGKEKVLILVSDGDPTRPTMGSGSVVEALNAAASLNAADAAKRSGTNIFTIHFGTDPSGYAGTELLANLASGSVPVAGHENGSVSNGSAAAENADNDNFFVAPTSADMLQIFNAIGGRVCPALAEPIPPPSTGTLIVMTQVINNNGGTEVPSGFSIEVEASGVPVTSFPGSSSGTVLTVNPGPYSITESPVDGYNEILSTTCSSVAAGNIAAGETRVCTIVNDDVPPPPPPPNFSISVGSWREVPRVE